MIPLADASQIDEILVQEVFDVQAAHMSGTNGRSFFSLWRKG
jgi:hypothetical protein